MSRPKQHADLLKWGNRLGLVLVCLVLSVPFLPSTAVNAQSTGYQEYYVLGYEEHVWEAFEEIYDLEVIPGSSGQVCSTVSLVATADYQVVYYDHWEDGYEADLLHPVQSSTAVYTLTVGASLSLTSTQDSGSAIHQFVPVDSGRDPADIRYDGGDRIISSGGPIALTHMMWPLNRSWIGGGWEIYSWQTHLGTYSYRLPIGEDLYTFGGGTDGTYGDFRNVLLELGAYEDNTTVLIDNGTDTVNLTLARGQSYSSLGYINSTAVTSITINAGTAIRSNKPVQVGLITGADSPSGAFQGRFLLVLPDPHWGADYIVPVPSGDPPTEAEVYLTNPNDFPITIQAYDAVISTTFSISSTDNLSATVPYSEKRGGAYVPTGSAARFTSSDGVFGVVVCADTSNIDYDWGFSGVPAKHLTRDYFVSWAPGDFNTPPENNGSPVWVTPMGDKTTFYVDFGPLDEVIDQTFTLDTLQQRRILDPDNDNTGMHVWATGEFAIVWGEDPNIAGETNPFLDLGVSVLPAFQRWLDPVFTLDKIADPTILPPAGGTVTFTLVAQAHNNPLVGVDITDTLPMSWTYVAGSTTVRYPDESTSSPDPTISDQTLFWDLSANLDLDQSITLSFQAQITTSGSVGATAHDGFESRSYNGGDNWAGSSWLEGGESDGPMAGNVTITDVSPFLGDYHLSIVSPTMSLSRTIDLGEFTAPILRLSRQISLAATSEYYVDVLDGVDWTTVLTWTNADLQIAYIQETIDLPRSAQAIRFRSGSSVTGSDIVHVDEVDIYDAMVTNINRGEAIGKLQYANAFFNPTDEAIVTIGQLRVLKSVSSSTAGIGDTLVYTLSCTNLSASQPATNVVLYDDVPVQYVALESVSAGGSYDGASGTITWTRSSLAPGATDTVTFSVSVNDFVEDGTTIDNVAYVVSDRKTPASSNAVRTTVLAPDVTLTKIGPPVAEQGQVITYTLTYENIGGRQATGVIIQDTIPISTTYVTESLAINTGSGWMPLSDAAGDDEGAYIAITPTLAITLGTVVAGEIGQIRFSVQITEGLPPGSLIRNWAVLDRDLDIPRESNLAITRISELLFTKAAETATSPLSSSATVAPSGLITYVLASENASTTISQTNVYIQEMIPDHTSLVSTSGIVSYSWNHGAIWTATLPITPVTHIRWYTESLAPRTGWQISFTVQVSGTLPANTTIWNLAHVTSTEMGAYFREWIPSNQVEVGTVDLWVIKSASQATVGTGQTLSYTILYGNRGSADGPGVQILDTIPTGTQYVMGSIWGTGADDSADPLLSWDVMTVPTGASAQSVGYAVIVDYSLIPGTLITNTAVLSSIYGTETSNLVVITTTASAIPTLTATKFSSPYAVDVGQRLTYTVVISNSGGHAYDATISDTLPANTQFVPASITLDPPTAGTPGVAPPILANDVTITNGHRVTVTFAVTVIGPLPDGTVITNTAAVTTTTIATPTTATVTTTVYSPVFTLTKHATSAGTGTPFIIGSPITYTITVTDTGSAAATGVVVTDTLPADAYHISGGSFIASSNTVSWTLPLIPADDGRQVATVISTCQASLLNDAYRVITSTQLVNSPLGPGLLALLIPPTVVANFDYSPAVVAIGAATLFTSTSTANGSPIAAWMWDFGDGNTGSGPTTTHVYSSQSTFTATLTVTDTCGYTDVATRTLQAHAPVLTITKRVDLTTTVPGLDLTYTIVLSNSGPVPAYGAMISDALPANTQFVPASISLDPPTAGTPGVAPPILANDVTITNGHRVTVTFAVTVIGPLPDSTVITNTAAVTTTTIATPTTATVTTTVYSPVFTLTKHATPAWTRRIRLTFTNTQQTENLIDFPVLVALDPARIDYAFTQDSGQDIRFFDSDTATLLPHEIEEWNEGSISYVWVKVVQIDGGSNTDHIWLYYGNPYAPDGQDPNNVWNRGYKLVHHLNETSGPHFDSTNNDHDSTAIAVTSQGLANGWVDGADAWDGSDDYVSLGSPTTLDDLGPLTFSAWFYARSTGEDSDPRIFSKEANPSGPYGPELAISGSSLPARLRFRQGFSTSRGEWLSPAGGIVTDTWYHVAVSYDNSSPSNVPTVYIDGVSVTLTLNQIGSGAVTSDAPYDFVIGNTSLSSLERDFDGFIDEVRLSQGIRTADWIAAQYRSMTDGFVAFGSEELAPFVSGAPFTYTIAITNTGSVPATGIVVTDTLPPDAYHISGGSFIAGSNTVSWTIPLIPTGDARQVTTVISTCRASQINDAYRVITSTQQTTSPPGPALLTVFRAPTLTASFDYSPWGASITDTVYFTSTSATNGSPIAIFAWDFDDGGRASGPTVSHIYTNPGIYTVTLRLTDTCNLTNTATTTLFVYEPDLAITKTIDSPVAVAGTRVYYDIAVSNTGQGYASDVFVTDVLPAGTIFVTATVPHIGPAGGVITWPLSTIPAGETRDITLTIRVPSTVISGTIITNSVSLTSEQSITDTDAITALVRTEANLAIGKYSTPRLFIPGETLTYTLNWNNYGPSIARTVAITDTLDPNVTFGSVISSPFPAPIVDGQSLSWFAATLSSGSSDSIVFTVTVDADVGDTITNTAVITSATYDQNTSNNTIVWVTSRYPVIDFAGPSFSAGESAGYATITVRPDYAASFPVTVTYQTIAGGTATPDVDYTPTSGTLILPALSTSQTFTVPILPDLLDEANETVVLSLTGAISATIGTTYNPATLSISDDDPPPNLSIDDVMVSEGDLSTVDAVFTVSLDAPSGQTVWVDYATADNTATAPFDYDAIGFTTLVFAPGETTKSVTVTVHGDQLVEGDEIYYVNLSSALYAVLADPQGVGTITDDDTATVSIITRDDAAEPITNGGYVISLTKPVATGLIVNYIVSGTASNTTDYATLTGSVTVPANTLTATLDVNVIDDNLIEGDETISVTLTSTANPLVTVDLSNTQATITIVDDDTGTVTISTQGGAAEPATSGTFVVSFTNPVTVPVTVNYAVGGTATPGDDYVALSGSIVIPANSLTATLDVDVINDDLVEGGETVSVTLITSDHALVTVDPASDQAILTIIDDDIATVSIVTQSDGSEPSADGYFVISLASPITVPATISYTVGGTATAGIDYMVLSESVVIPAYTFSTTVPVRVLDDSLVEGDETVLVTLIGSDHPLAPLDLTGDRATLTIADNDTAAVNIVTQEDGAEPASDGRFLISLTGTVATSLTVNLAVDGTATGGTDYVSLPSSTVIPAYVLSATLNVVIIDDTVYEGDETVQVTVTGTDNPLVTPGTPDSAALTLSDDDAPTVDFESSAYVIGESAGLAVITVTLGGDTLLTATVGYTTSDGTATASSDYIGVSGVLTFTPGVKEQTFSVQILADAIDEMDETVVLSLTKATNASLGIINPAVLTIRDDDAIPTVDFSSATYSVGEGDPAAIITVTLSNPSDALVSVDYQTASGGTATPGIDYVTTGGTLQFSPLSTSQTFAVSIIPDTLGELDETVVLSLTGVTNGYVGTTTNPSILTIVDDDLVIADFGSPSYTVGESDGAAIITVTLSNPSSFPVAVDYQTTTGGTATPGADYVATSGNLQFPPLTTNQIFTISILSDPVYDPNETVVLALTGATNGITGTTNNPAVLTIVDDDLAVIGGTVFLDTNGSGTQDGGETGIPGVRVSLDRAITVTTDASGRYLFTATVSGVYTVIEVDPGTRAVNAREEVAVSPLDPIGYLSTTPNRVRVNVILGNVYQVDFGDALASSGFAAIYGTVFQDDDGDGAREATELGMAGVSVSFDSTLNATTDAYGRYTFSTTVSGAYALAAADPGGYFATTPSNVQIDAILGFGYAIDFGKAALGSSFATVYGTVFNDDNGNAIFDQNETGISGVTVTLDDTASVSTGPHGDYAFSITTPGTHVLLETDPSGYTSTTPNQATVDVVLGNDYRVDFGDIKIGTCKSDLYEEDDTSDQARLIVVGTNQVRQFCDDTVDWVRFTAEADTVYTITTSSWGQRADTVLSLFDSDEQTLLAENDDYPPTTLDGSSRIVWQALADGQHYVRVTSKLGLTGQRTNYDLRVDRPTPPTIIYLPVVMRSFDRSG